MAYIPAETQGIGTGIISRGTGFDLDAEIRYDVQIVLNMGSGVEIKTAKIPLYLAPITIAKEDPEFLHVQLRWNDYYPPLGDKTIVVKADVLGEGSLDGRVLRAEVIYPLEGARLGIDPENKDLKAVESTIANDKATFQLSGRGLAPRMVIDGTETGVDEISIKFTLLSEGDNLEPEAVIYGSWNVKNNSNTTLAEVLSGEAVFVHDTVFSENHNGQTTGKSDNERRLDFVQKMINHIVVPLRTPIAEGNQKNTLEVDGYYGDKTNNALEAIIQGGADPVGSILIDTSVSHQIEANAPKTFLKLAKDYTGLIDTDIGKVIDKEVLVGLNHTSLDTHPIDHPDVGIYELYLSDDWDADGINNNIEVENNTIFDSSGSIVGSMQFNPLKNDSTSETKKLLRSFSRGSVGIKAKKHPVTEEYQYYTGIGPGNISTTPTEGDYSTVTISNGLRVPDSNKGYYNWRGGDAENTDNYSTIDKVQIVEAVGREWAEKHPYFPLHKNAFETLIKQIETTFA